MAAVPQQYDSIVSAYDEVNDPDVVPGAEFEEYNFRKELAEHIRGKRVLDLACGTGHYSRRLLQWGAESVVGVDVSSGMIEQARAEASRQGLAQGDRLRFIVGDASEGAVYFDSSREGEEHGFPVVIAAWLLNYAASSKDMESMWKTIGNNLQPGGVFLSMTIGGIPADGEELDRRLREDWPPIGLGGFVKRVMDDDEGFEVRNELGLDGMNKAVFDNFWLRRESYDRAARATGLFEGGVSWATIELPRGGKTWRFEWRPEHAENAYFAILKVVKKG